MREQSQQSLLPRASGGEGGAKRRMRGRCRSPHPALRATLSRKRERALLFLALALLTACARDVSRDEWLDMTATEKTLYAGSLLGAETARQRKGGPDRVVRGTPEEIVQRIDAAYAAGDQRPVEEVFRALPDPPAPRQQPASP